MAWVYELRHGSPPLNGDNVPIGGDYIAFHTAGRLLLNGRGAELYDRAAVVAVQDGLLDGRVPGFYDAFRNPPFAALPFVPLASLDLLPGFVVWSVVSLACLGLAAVAAPARGAVAEAALARPADPGVRVRAGLLRPHRRRERDHLAAAVRADLPRAGPRPGRRWPAFWAALGLFKPQLFFVFPLVLIARRSWRPLLLYGLIALGLAGRVAGAGRRRRHARPGCASWSSPKRATRWPTPGAWRRSSRSSTRCLASAPDVALGSVRWPSSALLLGALYALWSRRPTSICPVWIFTSLVAVLVDPHLVDYDLTVLVPAGHPGRAVRPTRALVAGAALRGVDFPRPPARRRQRPPAQHTAADRLHRPDLDDFLGLVGALLAADLSVGVAQHEEHTWP